MAARVIAVQGCIPQHTYSTRVFGSSPSQTRRLRGSLAVGIGGQKAGRCTTTLLACEMGTKDLFTKGLSTRVIMIGTLTGLQWWIYDSFKTVMGLGTTGGK